MVAVNCEKEVSLNPGQIVNGTKQNLQCSNQSEIIFDAHEQITALLGMKQPT